MIPGADYDPEVIYNTKRSHGEPFRHRVRKLRDARGNKCEECQAEERFDKRGKSNLEFAHIKPTGLRGRSRGQTQRFKDIAANPEAYKLLCRDDCHKALDRKKNFESRIANVESAPPRRSAIRNSQFEILTADR